jgi:hypothetical protein
MNSDDSFIMRKMIFAWIALATITILFLPWSAMQYTDAVNWSLSDFMVMGFLLFGFGSLFVVVARRVKREYWLAIGVTILAVFIYIWAELAVGIFADIGS